jgi:hypothetical protein
LSFCLVRELADVVAINRCAQTLVDALALGKAFFMTEQRKQPSCPVLELR